MQYCQLVHAMVCHTILCCTILYHTVLCSTVLKPTHMGHLRVLHSEGRLVTIPVNLSH
jgi:hypothetical protein